MASKLTASDVRGVFEKISNWGRWGKDDQRGALNFITDEKRAAAARLVQSGHSVSLALPLPTAPAIDNPTPVTHLMVQTGCEGDNPLFSADYFAISFHGMATTHIDALCHIFWNNKMYNGFDAREVSSRGAGKCGIDNARGGIVGRGVMLDIARLKNCDWLEPGTRILPQDLEAAEKAQRVSVGEGDILLVRTGRAAMRKVRGGSDPMKMPGLDATCLEWLHQRRIAMLGSDAVSDVLPSELEGIVFPIHVGTLVMLGVHLLDNADFDALAASCQKQGRSEFLFMSGPLVLERGTGSPVNPIAVF